MVFGMLHGGMMMLEKAGWEKTAERWIPAAGRIKEWTVYLRAYEAYFNDSFGWRNWLIMFRGLLVLEGWVTHPDVLCDVRSRMMFYRPDKASAGQFSTSRDVAKRNRVVR